MSRVYRKSVCWRATNRGRPVAPEPTLDAGETDEIDGAGIVEDTTETEEIETEEVEEVEETEATDTETEEESDSEGTDSGVN